MSYLIKFVQGMFIGAGCIAPGVSGGTLAVIFGLYNKIMDAIATTFKDLKNKIKYFLPIGLGGVVGVLLFSILIDFLFNFYEFQTKYAFIGLMIGTLPSVFKEANKNGFKKHYLIPFSVALLTTIVFQILDNNTNMNLTGGNDSFIAFVIYGAIIGFGTIVPGISASFILMYLGSYDLLIGAISDLNIYVILPVGVGFLLSIVLFAKFINFLFKKAYGLTYYAVLGLVIGSIIMIFPGVKFNLDGIISALLLLIGLCSSFCLSGIRKE